jgi:tRNA (cmo5U34)-methyltransferase
LVLALPVFSGYKVVNRYYPDRDRRRKNTVAIEDAFNMSVSYYDSWIRKAVPGYDDLFAIAGELMPFPPDSPVNVLDLGAGTGLFSQKVLEQCPGAHFALWDVSTGMLDVARERFRNFPDRFRYVVDDFRNLREADCFDMVISSLSIHHLKDDEKRQLFARIHDVLHRQGLFLNIDLIKAPTAYLEELYCEDWYRKMRRNGASEEEVQAGIERKHAYDREATLEDQLRWLREAGFTDADCVYRNYKMGLFFGVKR